MSGVDRNTGILGSEERLSLRKRRYYQEGFLRDLVRHAYNANTPLKAAIDAKGLKYKRIKTVEDLEQIPVTKKGDLTAHHKQNPPFGGFCTVPPAKLLRIHRSPGPIFDPVGNVRDYWRWKIPLYSVGFRPGDIVVNTFAYHLTPAGHMFEEGIAELGLTTMPTGVGNTETQVEILRDLPVTAYIGTPSFLLAIIKKAEEMGVEPKKDFSLAIGLLLAEMLPESTRQRLQEEYNIIGRQAYGTADVGCIAYECPQVNGMHIHYDVIAQICDPETGKPLPTGEVGEVVVTANNKIYPLVRFGTGDLSSIVEDQCPCGRTGPRLTGIKGRADQVTKVKGMFVHPSQVQQVIQRHPEIVKGRLVVDRRADQDVMTLEIEVKGEPGAGFAEAVEQTLRDVAKLKGLVKIVKPSTLPEGHKIIEDVRKWD